MRCVVRTKIHEDGSYVNLYDLIRYLQESEIDYHGDKIIRSSPLIKLLETLRGKDEKRTKRLTQKDECKGTDGKIAGV